ncbi:MAG: trehalose-phosphatase [Candidatus Aquicultor primus]|uniref:Trehalose 6-phosphate phosphatase n=1 Tax=Candidatus Aquicultor primus TaxID=1797195 RepID=A0A1F2UM54_9ACTN|nr:MAG: trehalose-phosphatase [Candidatus Aquicultor primus]HCG99853.1 trehalose-phosphatase [Actinomycetota bacterium]
MDIHSALVEFKAHPGVTGIFSDLDGTLSAIAQTPESASVTAEVREALTMLKERYKVVGIVSGRASDDAQRMVGLNDLLYIGSHGLEWIEEGRRYYAPQVKQYLGMAPSLYNELSDYFTRTDIRVEKKNLGAALHYRLAADKDAALALIEPVVEKMLAEYPMKVVRGRFVVELKPDIPLNKGDAIVAICQRDGLAKALYIGDDITDIDAFKALRKLEETENFKAVSVAVASKEADAEVAEAADFTLASVDEVEALLRWLAE